MHIIYSADLILGETLWVDEEVLTEAGEQNTCAENLPRLVEFKGTS
jgi:hypothetical protein